MSFINKIVLVTGAGSGIGEAISIHFAKLSARLSLVDIDSESLKKTAESCEKITKAKVLTTVADLRNDDHVKNTIEKTRKEYGRIDIVVNCAGIYKPASILDPDLIEVFDNIMASNLRSVVKVTNFVAATLAESKGCIINISSASPILGAEASVPYQVAIASLNHFTSSVALDLAPHGVRINSILPGVTKTNILANAGISPEDADAFWNKNKTPLNRSVKTDDVAELAVFLASEKAKAMTGCSYPVDAGLVLVV